LATIAVEVPLSMNFQNLFTTALFLSEISLVAQIKTTNWSDAGYKGSKPVFAQTVNIMSVGGNTNGISNNGALISAISALNNKAGVIYFPPGIYSFTSGVNLNKDSILLLGAGHGSTRLYFSMSGAAGHCFTINGAQVDSDTSSFTSPGVRDSNWTNVLNSSKFKAGDWVYLQCNDSAYMASTWAYRSLGQVMQVKSVSGSRVDFYSLFRFNYALKLKPMLKKIIPAKVIGFECLAIKRTDPTVSQTSLIAFDRAVQCWLHGIEGDSTNYAHVELNRSANVSITNSWFHHAHAYGGGGQGYGLALQYSASECLAENNVFEHLRHSVLFQAGANGNVFAYNYSFDPNWQEGAFPPNSAGDIVFHGNFPFSNLAEGNINQNTIIDNSHGINGPYNTIFRNRTELYGLIMNSGAGDTMQFINNEITSTAQFMGNYSITGSAHTQMGNLVRSVLTPSGSASFTASSLYLSGNKRPLCFNSSTNNWPEFGDPVNYASGYNAAFERNQRNIRAECECTFSIPDDITENSGSSFYMFPNPAGEQVSFLVPGTNVVSLFTMEGTLLFKSEFTETAAIDIRHLAPGIYLIKTTGKVYAQKKLIISR
jgi:hypothetical protein